MSSPNGPPRPTPPPQPIPTTGLPRNASAHFSPGMSRTPSASSNAPPALSQSPFTSFASRNLPNLALNTLTPEEVSQLRRLYAAAVEQIPPRSGAGTPNSSGVQLIRGQGQRHASGRSTPGAGELLSPPLVDVSGGSTPEQGPPLTLEQLSDAQKAKIVKLHLPKGPGEDDESEGGEEDDEANDSQVGPSTPLTQQ